MTSRLRPASPSGFVNARDIANRLNLGLDQVRQWTHRGKANFPAPVGWDEYENARLWLWIDVRQWAVDKGFWDGRIEVRTGQRRVPLGKAKTVDLIDMGDRAWQKDGLCKERPDVNFFPRKGQNRAARNVCAQCVVRNDCLMFATRDPETEGVWAGYVFPVERVSARRELATLDIATN